MIAETLFAKNQETVALLKLKPGDIVVRITEHEFDNELRQIEQAFVISSIQANGRVFFKGGNRQSAWPIQLQKKWPNDSVSLRMGLCK